MTALGKLGFGGFFKYRNPLRVWVDEQCKGLMQSLDDEMSISSLCSVLSLSQERLRGSGVCPEKEEEADGGSGAQVL